MCIADAILKEKKQNCGYNPEVLYFSCAIVKIFSLAYHLVSLCLGFLLINQKTYEYSGLVRTLFIMLRYDSKLPFGEKYGRY